MKKMPIVITYQETTDKGEELRYTLRSLKNITNWNGEVFVVGDSEDWFTDKITYVPMKRSAGLKHRDLYIKLRKMIMTKEIADDFIYMNDDMYIMENMPIKHLNQGEIKRYAGNKGWLKIKQRTRHWLHNHGYDTPLDYDLHVPMIFNKKKLAEALDTVEAEHPDFEIQVRSIYGNMHKLGGEYYEDGKLCWDAPITSTNEASQLENIAERLSEPSEFEICEKTTIDYPITVLMPLYNETELLKRAINSIPKDWQIIACDDKSTDGTLQLLKEIRKERGNMRVLFNKKNVGVGHTLNKLYNALGEGYHVQLSGDDYFYPDIAKAAAQIDGEDLVYFEMVNNQKKRWIMNKDNIVKYSQSVKFVKNELIKDIRNDGTNYMEDVQMMEQIVAKKPTMKFTGILGKHYNHPREGSLSWEGRRGKAKA